MAIALNAFQAESNAYTLEAGTYVIAAGVVEDNDFPSKITLEVRFLATTTAYTDWQETDVVLSNDNGWQDVFQASSNFEYRLVAASTGAVVRIEQVSESFTPDEDALQFIE